MEGRKTASQLAHENYAEAIRTANRIHTAACKEADRQYELFLQPFREAFDRALEEEKKEITA